MKRLLAFFILLAFFTTGCSTETQHKEKLEKLLVENPEILTKAIEANPVQIMAALQKSAAKAQEQMGKNQEEEEKKKFEESFNAPLKPEMRPNEAMSGPSDAPLTLVAYSDFECPFCSKSHATVQELKKIYGNKIRYVFKHLPLDFHKFALPAAKYFEAIKLQNMEKAFKFHDMIFDNQKELQKGEAFLDSLTKKVGADLAKVKKDINSPTVLAKIEQDQAEAKKFDISGTPGYILNGIPIRGAYPLPYFQMVIEELKKRGKITL